MRKITIITGANSGMGLEFARQFYEKENVASQKEYWLIARNLEKLKEAKNQILSSTDSKKEVLLKEIPMDISGKEGVEKFKSILENEKQNGEFEIEILVNNAGFGTYGEFSETPLEKEIDMVDLNCTSLTGLCGLCIPFMKKGSRIINVSSLAAFFPLGNFAVYGATKAFVLSFSIALAAELKDKGIKVLALCPGSVSTNFANVASNGARKEVLHGKDPVKVVRHCIKLSEKGKKIALWSPRWKFTAFISRLVGRYLAARVTFKFAKRPYNHES